MARKFKLQVEGPDRQTGGKIPGQGLTIGQARENKLRLSGEQVSPRHARLECTANECRITDLDSRYGTTVDGTPLPSGVPTILLPGAKIRIGPYTLTFQVEDETPDPPPSSDQPSGGQETQVETPDSADSGSDQNGGGDGRSVALNGDGSGAPGGWSSLPPDLCGTRLLTYLPEPYHPPKFNPRKNSIFHPNYFLVRFLGIFEAILNPIERSLDNFDLFLNPGTAPADFLPWLATWFDLIFEPGWHEDQQRQFLREASRLYAYRGTRWALSRILEIYTGESPLIDDGEEQPPHTFTVIIRLPAGQTAATVDPAVVNRIIQATKPAHTHCELRWQQPTET